MVSSQVFQEVSSADPAPLPAPVFTQFSDAVRVIAMIGVVAIHASWPLAGRPADEWYTQAFKACDGLFMFVSGYLWQFKDGASHPGQYLWARIRSLMPGYLFWSLLMLACEIAVDTSSTHQFRLVHDIRWTYTAAPFWFVPQLLLSLWVVSIGWRTIGVWATGAVTLAIALFYGFNIYGHWVDFGGHTEAPLGFAFCTWLGFIVRTYESRTRALLTAVPMWVYAAAVLAVYYLCGHELMRLHNDNTLRPLNMVFTVLFCAALLAAGYRYGWRHREKVRGTAFGIYLVHSVLVYMVFWRIFDLVTSDSWRASYLAPWPVTIVERAMFFGLAWFPALAVVRILQRTPWPWIVGEPTAKKRPLAAPSPSRA